MIATEAEIAALRAEIEQRQQAIGDRVIVNLSEEERRFLVRRVEASLPLRGSVGMRVLDKLHARV